MSGASTMVMQDASPFVPQTLTFNTAGANTVTIPAGASTMQIDCFGGTGNGGTGAGSGCAATTGSGGASSSRSSSSYPCASNAGQTVTATVGAQGPNASTVVSGTFTITSMNAPGGVNGNNAPPNGAATAGPAVGTGGNVSNAAGNGGASGVSGGAGGAGLAGPLTTGPFGGTGGLGVANSGRTLGSPGLIVVKFT